MSDVFPLAGPAYTRKEPWLKKPLLVAPHADELLGRHGAVPRHCEVLAFSEATSARRVNEPLEARQRRAIGGGMRSELCVPLEQWSTDKRALAVVGCQNTRCSVSSRSLKRRLGRGGSGCCECG